MKPLVGRRPHADPCGVRCIRQEKRGNRVKRRPTRAGTSSRCNTGPRDNVQPAGGVASGSNRLSQLWRDSASNRDGKNNWTHLRANHRLEVGGASRAGRICPWEVAGPITQQEFALLSWIPQDESWRPGARTGPAISDHPEQPRRLSLLQNPAAVPCNLAPDAAGPLQGSAEAKR